MEGTIDYKFEADTNFSANLGNNSSFKIKEFALDTKGVCFLCLEIISRGHDDTSVASWMAEICLRNICMFLKVDPQLILEKSRIAFEIGKGAEFLKTSKAYDFSVRLCEKCYTVTSKLTSMIKELEIVKMLLDERLRTFYKILVGSQRTYNTISSAWETVEAPTTSGLLCGLAEREPKMEAKLIDTLRKETEDKCRIHIAAYQSSTFPRVLVCRVDDNPKKLREPRCNSPDETQNEASDSLSTDMRRDRMKPTDKSQNCSLLSHPHPTSGSGSGNNVEIKTEILECIENTEAACKITELEVPSSEFPQSSDLADPYCETEINSGMEVDVPLFSVTSAGNPQPLENLANMLTSIEDNTNNSCEKSQSKLGFNDLMNSAANKTQPHMTCLHPDKIFATKKLSQISDTTFKEISQTLWMTEAKQALFRNSPALAQECKENTRLECPYCKRTFAKNQCIMCHYVKYHYQILAKKLLKIQNFNSMSTEQHKQVRLVPTLSKIPDLTLVQSPATLPTPTSFPTFSLQPSLSINQSSFQPELQRTALPPIQPNCSSSFLCPPPKHFMLPPGNETLKTNCEPIQKEQPPLFHNTPALHNNVWAQSGAPIMNNSSNIYNNDASFGSTPIVKSSNQTQILELFPSENDGAEGVALWENDQNKDYYSVHPASSTRRMQPVTCQYCQKTLARANKLCYHILRKHLEEMFATSRLPHVGLEDFKRFCQCVLQQEVNLCRDTADQADGGIVKIQCYKCERTYRSTVDLRLHLCRYHVDSLSESLKRIQGNPQSYTDDLISLLSIINREPSSSSSSSSQVPNSSDFTTANCSKSQELGNQVNIQAHGSHHAIGSDDNTDAPFFNFPGDIHVHKNSDNHNYKRHWECHDFENGSNKTAIFVNKNTTTPTDSIDCSQEAVIVKQEQMNDVWQ